MKKFKGECGKVWVPTAYRDGHISVECTHNDGFCITTDIVGVKEEAIETCKKCPYSANN